MICYDRNYSCWGNSSNASVIKSTMIANAAEPALNSIEIYLLAKHAARVFVSYPEREQESSEKLYGGTTQQ